MSTLSFEYRAFTADGKETRGVATAASKAEAHRQLIARGLTPVLLRAAGEIGVGRGAKGERIKPRDLAHFTYQFSVLVNANIPVAEGLRGVGEQEREGPLRDMVFDLVQRIQSGQTIADAVGAYRSQVGEVYVETLRAAEKTGTLGQVLEHLSEMLERGVETSRQVRGALMYPACVVGVLVLAVTFLVGFVIPKFATMFKRHGSELPIFTKVLLEVGQSMQNYWWAYLLGVGAVVFIFRRLTKTEDGLLLLDKLAHRIPYIKRILIGIGVARFSRILGLSLGSGLSLIEALTLAGKASGRPMLRRESIEMAGKVRAGATLASVLGESAYLTPFSRRMLTAGERSSEIPRMCNVVSRHYEREASDLTKNLSTVIEPVLVVAIAGVVLVVAMAIFLPMWDSMKMVGG